MFLVYNLNIITYRHDSFLFNYHATIINQLLLFCKKDVRFFPQNARIRAIYTSI